MASNPNDKAGSTKQRNRRGRPSISQQIKIEEKLWPYFDGGICPTVAARESEIDRKTVRNYYKKFAELPLRNNEKAFIEQCKINLASAETAISNILLKLGRYEEEQGRFFRPRIESNNISPKDFLSWQRELRKLAKTFGELIVLKTNLANSPTADLTLNRLARELTQIVP